jgi:hypothetical protein
MVGLGRIELPTSPLSGVRSSRLSYRPEQELELPGGAGRDRTGDLLSANQALSQLSYSPKKTFEASWTPEDHEASPRPLSKTRRDFQVEIRSVLPSSAEAALEVYGVERLSPTGRGVHCAGAFLELHPRSLLERR